MPERSSLFPLVMPGVAVVAAALVSYWFYTTPLHSSRPAPPTGASQLNVGEQTIEARLWQDPFKAATDGYRAATGKSAGDKSAGAR